MLLFSLFCLVIWSAGDWTQSFAHASRASYCWAASSPHNLLSKGMMIRQWTSDLWKLTGTFKSSVLSEFMLSFSFDGCFEVGRRVIYRWEGCWLLSSNGEWTERLHFHKAALFASVSPLELTRTKEQDRSLLGPETKISGFPFFSSPGLAILLGNWTEPFIGHFSSASLVNGQVWLL